MVDSPASQPNPSQLPQNSGTSFVWQQAMNGLKWGIYVGVGLKCLDSFIALAQVDGMTAFLLLVAIVVVLFPKRGVITAAAIIVFSISRLVGINWSHLPNPFLIILGSAVTGAMLGSLPGMAIGGIIGLARGKSTAFAVLPQNQVPLVLKSIVLPLIGTVVIYVLYFSVINPWLISLLPENQRPLAPVGGTISGRVLDENNKPIIGADVALFIVGDNASIRTVLSTKTDASGNYRLTEVAIGGYGIRASSSGRSTKYWQNATNLSSATTFSVGTNGAKIGIDFILNPSGATILGKVLDDNNKSINGAYVTLFVIGDNASIRNTGLGAKTDASGNYRLTGVTIGDYKVGASASGKVTKYWQNVTNSSSATTLSIVSTSVKTGIDFILDPSGTISGTVTDAGGRPLPNTEVMIYSQSRTSYKVNTDDKGVFSSRSFSLPLGSYTVFVLSSSRPVTLSSQACDATSVDFTLTDIEIAHPMKSYFRDDFSNNITGWGTASYDDRQYGYDNGEYSMLIKKSDLSVYSYWAKEMKDFAAEVDIKGVSGSGGAAGFAFGINPLQQTSRDHYVFLIRDSDGAYLISKRLSGKWNTLVPWTQSKFIKKGSETNHLKILRVGEQIQAYANGQLLTNISDSSLISGWVGLEVDTYTAANAEYRFDNFWLAK